METPERNALQVHLMSWEELHIFFHPDYTVGFGVSPNQPFARVADFTASGEFHPALKTSYSLASIPIIYAHVEKARAKIKTFVLLFLDGWDNFGYNRENCERRVSYVCSP